MKKPRILGASALPATDFSGGGKQHYFLSGTILSGSTVIYYRIAYFYNTIPFSSSRRNNRFLSPALAAGCSSGRQLENHRVVSYSVYFFKSCTGINFFGHQAGYDKAMAMQ